MLWELGFQIGSSESASDWRGTGPPSLRFSTPHWALLRSGGLEGRELSTGPGVLALFQRLASDAYQLALAQGLGGDRIRGVKNAREAKITFFK